MTPHLATILRHPIKAHGREAIASAPLTRGACLPWDRHWAVAHRTSRFDAHAPSWVPCANFQRAARTQALMAITARWDEDAGVMTLDHPDLGRIAFDPDREAERFLSWVAPISAGGAFAPVALVTAGRGMTDSAIPSLSIHSLASNAALGAHMGRDLSIHRWRANLWIDGLAPWEEMSWIGRTLRIGTAMLRVKARIGRCKATTADPDTGRVDADTLRALREVVGAQDFGLVAVVVEPGRIGKGDEVTVC